MEYRIEKKQAFRVVGLVRHTTMENGECYQAVPALWGEVMQCGKHMEILGLMNAQPMGLIGMSVYGTDPADAKKFDLYIACATDKPVPEGMEEYTVPAAVWAVFPCTRETMMQVQDSIVTDWQPESGYELLNSGYQTGEMIAGAPDLEIYGQEDDVEIWLAVRKK